jgi:hypothetical protein
MTIEIFYLTEQLNRWLNLQVAHHLEAQAARLKPAKGTVLTTSPKALEKPKALGKLGADGPGGSVGLDCRGMPDCGESVEQAERVEAIQDAAAGGRFPAPRMAICDDEKQTVSA